MIDTNTPFQKAGFLNYEGDVLLSKKKYKESTTKYYNAYKYLLECQDEEKIEKYKVSFFNSYINSKSLYCLNVLLPKAINHFKNKNYDDSERIILQVVNDSDIRKVNHTYSAFTDMLFRIYEKKHELLYDKVTKHIKTFNLDKIIHAYLESYILTLIYNDKYSYKLSKKFNKEIQNKINKKTIEKNKIKDINIESIRTEFTSIDIIYEKYIKFLNKNKKKLFLKEFNTLLLMYINILSDVGDYLDFIWRYKNSETIYSFCMDLLLILITKSNNECAKNIEEKMKVQETIKLKLVESIEKIFDEYINKAHKLIQIREYKKALNEYKEAFNQILKFSDQQKINEKISILKKIIHGILKNIEMEIQFKKEDKNVTREVLEIGINYAILINDENKRNFFELKLNEL